MVEQERFFSSNHNRLLSIATWAKYLAWIILVIYILLAALQLLQYRGMAMASGQAPMGIWSFYKSNPLLAFRLLMDVLVNALKGVIFYLGLKGLSLGLNMIVETDINYREQRGA
jgi:hypothetical protein